MVGLTDLYPSLDFVELRATQSEKGYIEAIREVEQQLQNSKVESGFDDIVVACGSEMEGGPAIEMLNIIVGYPLWGPWLSIAYGHSGGEGGTLKGVWLLKEINQLHSPITFNQAAVKGKIVIAALKCVFLRVCLGYAMSTAEELQFMKEIAETTGVILDPVSSGKAAYGMVKDMAENSKKWEGKKILFIHTGGLLGLYDKNEQIAPLVGLGKWRKMDIHESLPRKEGVGKMS
ncbi:hypothetical protein M9H77_14331 [Catharanthus roseus]|uniref:Uncharacterized protein n=1 Tax=Catharanthus roseus TaxID=4058 RepID=A0ACC0BMY3_CATRO|nr:hypothetical protein M9H77_14331 [Catharanthus roseus]